MGLVYFAVVSAALLALDRLIGWEGSFGKPPRGRKLTVAHATN